MPKRLQAIPTPLQRLIRERRKELKKSDGLTQTDIARAIGIQSPEFITLLEQGRRNIDLNRIPQLADVLKINRKDLCRLALYEAAPGLYAALFDSMLPPTTGQVAAIGDEDEEPAGSIVVSAESVYPIGCFLRLPEPLRKSVERLIEELDKYAWPAYHGRDRD